MQVIHKVVLSTAQKRVVKRICQIQLGSLRRLINSPDCLLQEITEGFTIGALNQELEFAQAEFQKVWNTPESFPSLDEYSLSIFTTILSTRIDDKKYPIAKRRLYAKVFKLQKLRLMYNAN